MEATLWPYDRCKKCANKNYCAWSESEILNCMNNGYPNFSPIRNADRIRAMTDEQLANFICGVETDGRAYGPRGRKAWIDWLKQEETHE